MGVISPGLRGKTWIQKMCIIYPTLSLRNMGCPMKGFLVMVLLDKLAMNKGRKEAGWRTELWFKCSGIVVENGDQQQVEVPCNCDVAWQKNMIEQPVLVKSGSELSPDKYNYSWREVGSRGNRSHQRLRLRNKSIKQELWDLNRYLDNAINVVCEWNDTWVPNCI